MPELERIYGTEMEWPISVRTEGSRNFQMPAAAGINDVGRSMVECVPPGVVLFPSDAGTTNKWLSNGAKYYVDAGGWLEYATPETASPMDCVEAEFAGEYIVMHSLANLLTSKEAKGVEEAYLQKQVVDDFAETWGYHVNISAKRDVFENMNQQELRMLLTHYATGVAFLGAGNLYTLKSKDKNLSVYSLAQKVPRLTADIDSGTQTGRKPFINTRDEPHADKAKYRRMHIVGTDPHISPWALWMMLGTSSMMLAAEEQGKGLDIFPYAPHDKSLSARQVANTVAHDLTFRRNIRLMVAGEVKEMKAYEAQAMLIEAAEGIERTDEETEVLEEWKRAATDLKEDPMRLNDRSDGIAKLGILQDAQARYKVEGVDDPRLAQVDLRYGRLLHLDKRNPVLDPAKLSVDELQKSAIAYRLRRTRFASRMPREEAITSAVVSPVPNTRAHRRGMLIRDTSHDRIHSVGWDSCTVLTPQGVAKQIKDMTNPFNIAEIVLPE